MSDTTSAVIFGIMLALFCTPFLLAGWVGWVLWRDSQPSKFTDEARDSFEPGGDEGGGGGDEGGEDAYLRTVGDDGGDPRADLAGEDWRRDR